MGASFKAIFTNPVKATKLKNNAKKYAKFKLDMASVEMDNIRKKQAALKGGGSLSKEDKEKLDQAKKSKLEALKGKIDAVSDRMKQIATTPAMQKFSSLVKSKADLEASKKLLKIAQGEENNALKIKLNQKIEKLKSDITNKQDELQNYSKVKDKKSTSKDKESNNSNNSEESNNSTKNKDAKEPNKEDSKGEESTEDKIAKIESDISTINNNINIEEKSIDDNTSKLKNLEDDQKNATNPDSYNDAIRDIKKKISDSKEDIKELNKEEDNLKKELKKLQGSVNDSINTKEYNFKEEKVVKEKVQNQLMERINIFKSELTTNPEYNRTPQARNEVERRIARWEETISEMNEKNFLSYESSINMDMNQLSTDLQSINSRHEQANNPQIQQAMQEAQSLGNPGQANPEQSRAENEQKLDKTREAMRRAGLL